MKHELMKHELMKQSLAKQPDNHRALWESVGLKVNAFWSVIRRLSGDDAYERYLKQHAEHHPNESYPNESHSNENNLNKPPLSREEFFKRWQEGKWTGVKRCC